MSYTHLADDDLFALAFPTYADTCEIISRRMDVSAEWGVPNYKRMKPLFESCESIEVAADVELITLRSGGRQALAMNYEAYRMIISHLVHTHLSPHRDRCDRSSHSTHAP